MDVFVDKEAIQQAGSDIRKVNSDAVWALFAVQGTQIEIDSTGEDIDEFPGLLEDHDLCYVYAKYKIKDSDGGSDVKFVLITWLGRDTSVTKVAKLRHYTSSLKTVLPTFDKHIVSGNVHELMYDEVVRRLKKPVLY